MDQLFTGFSPTAIQNGINLGAFNGLNLRPNAPSIATQNTLNNAGIKTTPTVKTVSTPVVKSSTTYAQPGQPIGAITNIAQAQAAGAYDRLYGAGAYSLAAQNGYIPTPPSSTITANNLSSSNSYTLPQDNNLDTAHNNLAATVNTYTPQPVQTDPNQQNQTPNQSSGTTQDAIKERLLGLINQQGNYAQEQQNIFKDEGVYQKQQALNDINNQMLATKHGYDTQINALQTNGGLTQNQAAPQIQELQRKANFDLANLAIQQQAASNNYQNAFNIANTRLQAEFAPIDKQISALQNFYQLNQDDLSKSQQDQLQAQIQQQQTDRNNLFTAKQQAYQTAIQYGAPADVLQAIGNAQSVQDVYNATSGLASNGGLSGGQGGGQSIPAILTGTTATASNGVRYVDASKITPGQEKAAIIQAKQAGIPVLSSDDVAKVRSIDVTSQNLQGMAQTLFGDQNGQGGLLGSGVFGRIGSSVSNFLSGVTQSDPRVASFNNYRLTAINELQSLGAGSGGARITQGEIKTATDNLPTLYDNQETAKAKLNIVNGYLQKWNNEIVGAGQSSANKSGNQSGQVVQTKVGAISTNW